MRVFGALLLGYAALALQAAFAPYIAIGGIEPDLPLVATVILASLRGPASGTACGFLIGLGQDLSNPAFLGLNALAKSILGYGVGTLRERFEAGNAITHAIILFVATPIHDLIYLTVYTRLSLSEMIRQLATTSLPTALYTAALGMWLFTLLASMSGKRGHRLGRSRLAGS